MSDTNFRHCELIRDRLEAVQNTDWGRRHTSAFKYPRPVEKGIVGLIEAAASYADRHVSHHGSRIGDDGVLGEHWADIVRGILGLLNGDCGRLDCGTLDGLLRDMLAAEGFDRDN